MAPNEKVADNGRAFESPASISTQAHSIESKESAIKPHDLSPNIVATEFKTKSGKNATIYRTNEFRNFPLTKIAAVAFHGSALAFFQGIAVVAAFLSYFPGWFTVPILSLYAGHVAFSSAHHTGSMASSWYRKCALAFAGFEYFNFAMSMENDVQLRREKPYLFGVHPHGIYGFGQVMWMSTRDSNPFYRLFPFLIDRCL